MSTNFEAPHYAVSSILPLLQPSLIEIFFLEPFFRTPSVYALSLMWESKFHAHKTTGIILVLYILTFTYLCLGLTTCLFLEANFARISYLPRECYAP
jgi:hypothetical protein